MILYLIVFMYFFAKCDCLHFFLTKQIQSLIIVKNALTTKTRYIFRDRANRGGVPWDTMTNFYRNKLTTLQKLKREIENPYLYYPHYYKKPFHGYADGNLNWLAALEAKPATLNIAVNYWKNIDPFTAECWLRNNFTESIIEYLNENYLYLPVDVLDLGCSIGISTEYLKIKFPYSNFIGMDFSPYFLSVASLHNEMFGNTKVKYIHANVENTHLPKESVDLISIQFLFHEVPLINIHNILNESYRLLTPNGTIAILDLNPQTLRAYLIKNPFKQWAFEITEPHIVEYYQLNMIKMLQSAGFQKIIQKNNDPMNCVWIATKL